MQRFSTISEFLTFRHLPKPSHPLVYVFKVEPVERELIDGPQSWCYDFYAIGIKKVPEGQGVKLKYGQQTYDFNEGKLSFIAPGQVMSFSMEDHVKAIRQSGWMLLVHPDLLWNTPLASHIKQYDFWDYSVSEALFLSEKEEGVLANILQNILQESQANIDQFSKSIIIAKLESFLNYADRFYHRQFLTREKAHHQILERLEKLLNDHFSSDELMARGLPTVAGLAEMLNLSSKYLSSLLKVLTGQNTQQHIHDKLIEKAKERLSTTELSVSEIAYGLGFEHIQSFSKLFKTKTSLSPLEFRRSFN
jgi:AraC-like DNA-binding protein